MSKSKKCKYCGKPLIIPGRAYLNLESYRVGGSVNVTSECCEGAYTIQMNVSYTITQYEGKKNTDDWGVKYKNKLNTK